MSRVERLTESIDFWMQAEEYDMSQIKHSLASAAAGIAITSTGVVTIAVGETEIGTLMTAAGATFTGLAGKEAFEDIRNYADARSHTAVNQKMRRDQIRS